MACTPPKIHFGAIDAQLIAYGAGGMEYRMNTRGLRFSVYHWKTPMKIQVDLERLEVQC